MQHTKELGFRDFSSLFLVKENYTQPGNSKCCISFVKVSSNIASLCNGRMKRKGDAVLDLECGDRIERFYEDSPEATIRATVNRLLSDRDEGMGLV
jgi:hypothetical protein